MGSSKFTPEFAAWRFYEDGSEAASDESAVVSAVDLVDEDDEDQADSIPLENHRGEILRGDAAEEPDTDEGSSDTDEAK